MLQTYFHPDTIEAGCDEAGRGCLAGPVYAAAVILPAELPRFELIKDSKQLTLEQRQEARTFIQEHALAWAVASCTPEEIDEINILNASFLAMHRAIDQLDTRPDLLLIDGNRFTPYLGITHQCIVKGDSKFLSIAAASILAKTYRDEYMLSIEPDYPDYGWKTNKGYPTVEHRNAVRRLGATPHHRKSFKIS
jgi:ribonuclease HII